MRVLSHEINNSLAPIASLSASLQQLAEQPNNSESLKQYLRIIEQRANNLIALVERHKSLSQLPSPQFNQFETKQMIERVVALYPKQRFELQLQPVSLKGDEGQLEQVLINLIKNAIEAHQQAENRQAQISINSQVSNNQLTIDNSDQGTGIQNPKNLFVPFYSTKEEGSGLGLTISRQIVRAHG